ncbi:MAG: hypothetical protein MUE98_05135 [Rhodobacteraceae bacterium]|jgi:hypothetical protein|nr:hypothetical protein [Paracoccaceae bacterium]
MRRSSLRFALAAAVAGSPTLAGAEAWTALVIGNPGPGAEDASAYASLAAETLTAAGLSQVVLEREVPADAVLGTVEAVAGAPAVVIYIAAPLTALSDGPMIGSAQSETGLSLGTVLRTLAEAGTRRAAVLIEDCGGPAGQAGRVNLPPAPEGLELFLAASAGPDGTCGGAARLTEALRDAQAAGPLDLDAALSGLWVGARMAEATVLGPERTGGPEQGGSSPVFDVVEADTADVVTPIAPVSQVETVVPATAPQDAAATEGGAVATFVAPSLAQIAAQPTAEGFPEPSIIVGLIETTAATFGTVDDTAPEVTSNEIAFDNLDARRAFKAQDPELFAALVESGAFDPPDVQLARVLQEELARMGCYRAAIDGDWGNGSRAAVDRYFAELDGVEPVGRDPTVGLYRQIILRDDVACPEPEPAVATTSEPRRTTTPTRTATTPRQQPAAQQPTRRTQQPAQQPAQQQQPRTLRNNSLGGVYR